MRRHLTFHRSPQRHLQIRHRGPDIAFGAAAIWPMVIGVPQQRAFRVQGSRLSRIHLVVLPDGRQHGLEVVEVEAGSDLNVGDHPLADPGVDAPGAD